MPYKNPDEWQNKPSGHAHRCRLQQRRWSGEMGRLRPVPVQLTVLEDNRGQEGVTVAVDDARIWIEWPTPESEELVYWTKLYDKRCGKGRLKPKKRAFTRKPKFLSADSFVAEVREDWKSGKGCTIAMIRFDRCSERPNGFTSLDRASVFEIQNYTGE